MNKLVFLAGVLLLMGCSFGDEVQVIDDSNVFISAPSVIYSSGWVDTKFISKQFTGDVDFAFGFNSSMARPSKSQLYQPHNVSWNTPHSAFFLNVSSVSQTIQACIAGNEYNQYKRLISYHVLDFDSLSNSSFQVEREAVVCFDSFSQVGLNYSIFWVDHHVRVEDWRDIPGIWSPLWFNYDGMDRWYYAKDIPVVAGRVYLMRFWLDVVFTGLDENFGKYDIAVKRSDESIHDAVANNRFYILDPWYASSWNNRRQIIINNTDSKSHDFEIQKVNVSYVVNKNSTRIVYDDSGTLRTVAFEFYNSSKDELFFIANSSIPATTEETDYYVYYNVSGGISEGNSTLFIARDDFEDNDISDWNYKGGFGSDTLYLMEDTSMEGRYFLNCSYKGDQSFPYTNWSSQTGVIHLVWYGLINEVISNVGTLSSHIAADTGFGSKFYFSFLNSGNTLQWYDGAWKTTAYTWNSLEWESYKFIHYTITQKGDIYANNTLYNASIAGSGTLSDNELFSIFSYGNNVLPYGEMCLDYLFVSKSNISIYIVPSTITLGAKEYITPTVAPSCSCSQYPPDLDFTNIGSNVSWDCNCSGGLLNHSSFMWLHSLGENWSFRPPDNLMSDAERRACNRYNKTLYPQYAYWYEYISDLPQLTDNIYVWGVHDYQSAKVDLIYSSVNQSNYSVSALFDHLMVSEWDLNRVFLQSEYKVNDFELIYTNKLGAKKFTKGSVRVNATYSCYINLESQGSSRFTSVYYCNESLVLLHEADPMSKDYCHFIDSFQDSVYAYSARNSSYVGDFLFRVNDSGFIDGVEAGSTYYLLVSLSENSANKATKWHYADAKNLTGDGVGFDNINRSFYSVDNGDTWSTGNYSFDIVCRYAHPDNDSLNWFVYLCNNDSVCWNSSVSVDVLGAFDNSPPNVLVISPGVGEVVSGMYNFTWDANDPDGDSMNFSGFLFNSDGSFNSTLFTGSYNLSFLWNSSSVPDGYWMFNVTAYDLSSNSSSMSGSFYVNNIPGFDLKFWVFGVLGSPIPDVSLDVRNASSNISLWSDLSDASGYALYPSNVYEELFIYLDFPTYSAVLSNVSGDPTVHINDWVTGRVRLSNSLGAFLEDQDCSVVVYDSDSVVVHDYDTRCRAGPSFVDRHGDWVSIGNCSLSDSGGWYFFKGRVDESMGFVYDESYDLVFTCNGQTANFSFTTSFEKTPLDMRKTEDFIRNYSGFFIVYGVFGFLCLLALIIICFILFVIKKN